MTGYPGDPAWDQILATSEEDDAWNELQARLDRSDDYTPAAALASVNQETPAPLTRPGV